MMPVAMSASINRARQSCVRRKGNVVANSAPNSNYGPVQSLSALIPTTVTTVGGSQAHLNMQPYLVLNFCIALQGIFPSQN